jgi:hypothetical protein
MLETASNHWQVVARSLNGEREVDEQTFASVAVLAERLEQLKRSDIAFSEVEFSPAVKKLQKEMVAVS